MAASLSLSQVIDQVQMSSDSEEDVDEPNDKDETTREKLVKCLGTFDGCPNFNSCFFKESGADLLLPLVNVCENSTPCSPSSEVSRLITGSTISTGALFQRESKLWLEAICRRLGGRRRIANPYYAEVTRDIPQEIFSFIVKLFKCVPVFCEPRCFYVKNRKAEVISFTYFPDVLYFFSLLTGLAKKDVLYYMKKTLSGARLGNKTKVLVSEEKDLALVYKISKGQLKISFHFGEWNSYGEPQHT